MAAGWLLLASSVSAAEPVLKTSKEKVSYAMAVAMARTVQRQGLEIDVGVFAKGMNDALLGANLLMTQGEMREALGGVLADLRQRQKGAAAGKPGGAGARK